MRRKSNKKITIENYLNLPHFSCHARTGSHPAAKRKRKESTGSSNAAQRMAALAASKGRGDSGDDVNSVALTATPLSVDLHVLFITADGAFHRAVITAIEGARVQVGRCCVH